MDQKPLEPPPYPCALRPTAAKLSVMDVFPPDREEDSWERKDPREVGKQRRGVFCWCFPVASVGLVYFWELNCKFMGLHAFKWVFYENSCFFMVFLMGIKCWNGPSRMEYDLKFKIPNENDLTTYTFTSSIHPVFALCPFLYFVGFAELLYHPCFNKGLILMRKNLPRCTNLPTVFQLLGVTPYLTTPWLR